MTTLNDIEIIRLNQEKNIITPFDVESVQPCSYDVHLGYDVLVSNPMIRSYTDSLKVKMQLESRLMKKGEFILATTLEHVSIPDDVVCYLHGVSTMGRRGLLIHMAGLIDPGFVGNITLELVAVDDVLIEAGMRIGQLEFRKINKCARPYNGRYQNQKGTTDAR